MIHPIQPCFLDLPTLHESIPHLGKYGKNHWIPSKTFLSFNHKNELKVRSLNVFQLLARKFLGWYQETHLNVVAKALNAYQASHGNFSPEIFKLINDRLVKSHQGQILDPVPEIFYFGNTTLNDAEIIGICQLHSDPDEAKFTAKILNENYREGDIILVEGIDSDKEVRPDAITQTLYFPQKAEIYGWEPIGFEALSAFVFESTIAILDQFQNQTAIIVKLLNNINFEKEPEDFKFVYANKEQEKDFHNHKPTLWNNCLQIASGRLIEAVGKIDARYVQNNPPEQKTPEHPFSAQLHAFMDGYKTFALSSKNEEEVIRLKELLTDLYTTCNQCISEEKYKNWTKVQDNFFVNTWDCRQDSLALQIKNFREQQKRIFICAGAAVFFPKRGYGNSPVLDTITQHKFTLGMQNIPKNATYYSFSDLRKRFE
jgi:hypothetical protein